MARNYENIYSCTLKVSLGLYAASKLDEHEQWVGSAGPSQKTPTKQVIANRPNWTVAGIMAVKNTNWGLCA